MIVWRVPLERAKRTDLINVRRISDAILSRKWRLYQTNNKYFAAEEVTAVNDHNNCRPMRKYILNLTLSLEYIFVARVRNFKYERANLRLRSRSFYILYPIIQFTCTLTYLLWFFILSNRGMHQTQTIGKPRNEFWSSLFLETCKGKIKLTLLLPIWKIILFEVLHLSSKSLAVSHQVHGNNLSKHKQKN